MKFLVVLSSFFAIALAAPQPFAEPACIAKGKLCAGFAGPIGECCKGLECRAPPQTADQNLCLPVKN
ncbi:hypothetical protein FQN54_005293 [Arachnomyces sp. PD_36]|nr:hypothetical protein FQN54_005293 [Arachnomyces sp. PD_36]